MHSISHLLAAAATAIAALVFSGCETESAGSASISINPGYARIMAGQSVTLSASGGNDYRWSLSNGSYGTLSANRGSSVVYTARKNGVTQVVTLNSTLGSSSYQCQATIVQGNAEYASTVTPNTSSSSAVSDGTQQSSSSSGGNTNNGELAITPNTAYLTNGMKMEFTASGGTNYSWSLDANGRKYGELDNVSGNKVTYTCTTDSQAEVKLTVSSTIAGLTKTKSVTIKLTRW